MIHQKLDRRAVFKSLIAMSAVGGLSACGAAEDTPNGRLAGPVASGYLTADELAMVAAMAQTIIPKTDTAGAVQAGVHETLQELVTDWGDADYQQYWRDGLAALVTALTTEEGMSFAAQSSAQRETVLAAYDASVYDGVVENDFYRHFKATVVQAYYMSEPGATEELAYEPVPGAWIGCVPLSDYPKNWAT